MANKGAGERINNYTTGVDPKTISDRFTAKKPQMITAETTIFGDLYTIEEHVKTILADTAGSTAIQSPFFQSASKEMYRIMRTFRGGKVVDQEMGLVVSKWTTRGLDQKTLLRIANEIFAWVPPAP